VADPLIDDIEINPALPTLDERARRYIINNFDTVRRLFWRFRRMDVITVTDELQLTEADSGTLYTN